MVLASSGFTHAHPVRLSSIAGLLDRNVSRICIANHSRSVRALGRPHRTVRPLI